MDSFYSWCRIILLGDNRRFNLSDPSSPYCENKYAIGAAARGAVKVIHLDMPVIRARSGHWNKNVNCGWGVTSGIDRVLRQLEIAYADLLPDLHSSSTMVVKSDYGGQHKGAEYESFSFLIADLAGCGNWNRERQRIRDDLFKDKRRMSYKALNDRQRRNALLPSLAAADFIPGFLATVLVRKALSDSYKVTAEERQQIPSIISTWPSGVLRKMTFIEHLGALFIAGLSAPGHNVFWFTDNDNFVANEQRLIDLTPLFGALSVDTWDTD